MPFRRFSHRGAWSDLPLERAPRRRGRRAARFALAALILSLIAAALFLRSLIRDIAISDARDAVTLAVNGCVSAMMREKDYGYDYFVTLEKDAAGNLTAITTNTNHINALSSEIVAEIARAADSEVIKIDIPVGSLFGSNLLMGRGPRIPIEVLMLTSSFVRFDNDLISTGINQSRHVIKLKAAVDVDILIPWSTIRTTVETDILLAETVIVGRVPDTYVKISEASNGS